MSFKPSVNYAEFCKYDYYAECRCTVYMWRYDTQHNDIQRNDTQHNDIQRNDTQHNDIHNNSK